MVKVYYSPRRLAAYNAAVNGLALANAALAAAPLNAYAIANAASAALAAARKVRLASARLGINPPAAAVLGPRRGY